MNDLAKVQSLQADAIFDNGIEIEIEDLVRRLDAVGLHPQAESYIGDRPDDNTLTLSFESWNPSVVASFRFFPPFEIVQDVDGTIRHTVYAPKAMHAAIMAMIEAIEAS